MPLPAIVPLIAAVGSSIAGMATQRRNVDKTNQAQMRLAEYQYSKDLEMWNRQNEYNSPIAQMARYKDAGLNPNLIYGSGGSAGNSATMPKYNAPTLQYNYPAPDFYGMLSQYQDFNVKQAQADNLKEQNRVIQETADLRDWQVTQAIQKVGDRAGKIPWEQELAKTKAQTAQSLMPYAIEFQSDRNRKQLLEMSKIKEDTEYKRLMNEWFITNQFAKYFGAFKGISANALKGISGKIRQTGRKEVGGKVRYNSPTFWNNLKR